MSKIETYISVDIESDGGYPGDYSMLSIGASACAKRVDNQFIRLNVDDIANQFYITLKPVTDKYVQAAVEVCKEGGLIRDELLLYGIDPYVAMRDFATWLKRFDNPIMVAYPLSFDWSFVYYYFCKYAIPDNQPFSFSQCLDIKTLYAIKAGVGIKGTGKRSMPKHLKSKRPHTHNALDDAIEQGELFCNIMEWDGNA